MKRIHQGFGLVQGIIVVAILGAVSMVAMPKYQAFITRSQLTEAMNIAHASKRQIEMYFMNTGHFPRTMSEAEAMKTSTLTAPEYVREMTVAPKDERDVIIKVFLKQGVVENEDGTDQYVYIQGVHNRANGAQIEWICGAQGIEPDLMPDNCKGHM